MLNRFETAGTDVWDVARFNCEHCFSQFVRRYIVGLEPKFCETCKEFLHQCLVCEQKYMIHDIIFFDRKKYCKSCLLGVKK